MSENIKEKTEKEGVFLKNIAENMITQFKNKNIAYGDSFGKQFEKYGAVSALIRLNDKFTRIEALITGAENNVMDESIEDTLMDMACYCLMTMYEFHLRNQRSVL